MIDYNEVVTATIQFRDVVKKMESLQNILEDIIQESDKSFGDIRHYIKVNYPHLTPSAFEVGA